MGTLGVDRWKLVVIVCSISAVLYLAPLLLDAPLTDPDEGLHAAISQEMVERGDLIVPRFLGRAFLDKPILFFWAQAASMRVFGMSTAAARLPGIVFALLGIATTGWLARVLFRGQGAGGRGQGAGGRGQESAGRSGQEQALVAAACYATMLLPFLLAQVPVHDIAVVPFTNLALGLLWRSRDPGSGNREPVIAGLALGLSILAKGLEGIAIVGVGYAAYLLITRALTRRLVAQAILVIVVAVIVALPWYLAMNAREPGYLQYYFFNRHLLGFTTETQRHGGQPWWYYLPVIIGGGLPWVVYAWPGMASRKRSPDGRARNDLLLWTWLGGAVVLLSFSNAKAVTYVLPAIPSVAILASRSETTLRQWRWVAIGATAVYAAALFAAGPTLARTHSSIDLAPYFNEGHPLPDTLFVMEYRVSFVYYLRPDVRARLHRDQIQSLLLAELENVQPFPKDAALALPADLADARLARLPQLAHAQRTPAGRYVLISQ